ncbi:hypothetical protein RYX36_019483 [Vicia faba]
MDSIPSSSSSSPLHSQQLLPFRFSHRLPFTSIRPFPNQKPRNLTSRASITFAAKQRDDIVLTVTRQNDEERTALSKCLTKELVRSLFCFAVGVSAFGAFRIAPAFAIPAVPWVVLSDKKKVKRNRHEYSDCTQRVLETVPGLLRSIEEARRGNGDVEDVKRALDVVKLETEKSEREILERMHPQLMELKEELRKLELREVEVSGQIEAVKREYDSLTGNELIVNEVEMKMLEQKMVELVKNYDENSEKIGEMEDVILRKETVALSYGVLEVLFIERECEQLVERFKQEVKQKEFESSLARSVNGLSKPVVQEDLETVQRKHLEQTILPNVVDVDDLEPFSHQDSVDFAQRLKRSLEDSREQQKNLVTQKGKNVKYDKEKRSIVYSPEEEETILLDRDRVVSRTWYNQEKNRWEMDPVAVPYAVTKNLIEHVRIRADWGTMYIALKGEDKEFYVDIKEFEILFKDIGGFDGLYRKMIACDIPTTVHLMWIPLSELKLHQQFSVILRLPRRFLSDQWNSEAALNARSWFFDSIKETADDIMMVIGFPVVELILPNMVRVKLGMAWPEEEPIMDTPWFLKWQLSTETRTNTRKAESEIQWTMLFISRTAISGFVLFHMFKFLKRKTPKLLGYGPVRKNPNRRKLGRVAYYFQKRWRSKRSRKRDGVDPIKTAFEHMKRVKKPPIPLKNFSSIESMKEEISEVVAFLQNPRAFQEMGARAPRGVLIVGERGTGKTSLALAIAAEAKVPVVEIKAQQLEAGMWVGQSASNVRELFQTARDLLLVGSCNIVRRGF